MTCEHDTRRITRTEYDGTVTVLIDKFDGKPLNSPNDVVVKSDDTVWFTDPPFGILGNYEGLLARRVKDLHRRGRRHAARHQGLRRGCGGTRLANGRTFLTAEPGGTPDGFRLDVDGNLWCGWGMGNEKQDGVKVFDPTGKPIAFIALPERCANVCFGGVKRNRLFMTASHSVYSLYVNTQGAPGG